MQSQKVLPPSSLHLSQTALSQTALSSTVPMYTTVLLRMGELFLKGKNQNFFLSQLKKNLHHQLGFSVSFSRGRFFLPYFVHHRRLSGVFGLSSYSPALQVEKKAEALQEAALSLLQGKTGTFKILTNRADKRFPLTSLELNTQIGKYIEQKTSLRAEMKFPEHYLHIELNTQGAYIFSEIVPGVGGLPVGVEGKVLLLLENRSSILAGILMMKRGCAIVPVTLIENENTKDIGAISREAEKDIFLLQQLSPFPLLLKKINSLSELDKVAQQEHASALVAGDTFQDLRSFSCSSPVFKPLIGYEEKEVKEILKKYRELHLFFLSSSQKLPEA